MGWPGQNAVGHQSAGHQFAATPGPEDSPGRLAGAQREAGLEAGRKRSDGDDAVPAPVRARVRAEDFGAEIELTRND